MRRRQWIAAAASVSMPSLISRAFAANSGVDAREIVIGQSAVLSGPLSVAMNGFNVGAQLAFDAVNAQGGVHRRRIRYISLDDELKPDRTVVNYKALLAEHKVFALFGGVGSANIAAVTPLLQESGAPVIGSYACGDSARQKAAGAVYFVRAGYGREAERLVQHLNTIGITRISVAHLAVPGGVEVLESIRTSIKALDASRDVVRSAGVKPDGSNAVEAGKELAQGGAQTIIMFLAGPPVAQLIKTVQDTGASPTFYGISSVAGDQVAKALGSQLRGLAVAQVVPYPWSDADATSREFRKLGAARNAPVSYYSYEGYINGLVLIEALRRAGQAPTRESLHAAVRSMKTRIGGMDLDFTSGPTGSRFVDLVHVTSTGRFVR